MTAYLLSDLRQPRPRHRRRLDDQEPTMNVDKMRHQLARTGPTPRPALDQILAIIDRLGPVLIEDRDPAGRRRLYSIPFRTMGDATR